MCWRGWKLEQEGRAGRDRGRGKIAGGWGLRRLSVGRAWDTISKKYFLPSGPAPPLGEGWAAATAIWAGQLGQPASGITHRNRPPSPPKFSPRPIGVDVAKPTWEPALLQPWEALGPCSTVICRASTWGPARREFPGALISAEGPGLGCPAPTLGTPVQSSAGRHSPGTVQGVPSLAGKVEGQVNLCFAHIVPGVPSAWRVFSSHVQPSSPPALEFPHRRPLSCHPGPTSKTKKVN